MRIMEHRNKYIYICIFLIFLTLAGTVAYYYDNPQLVKTESKEISDVQTSSVSTTIVPTPTMNIQLNSDTLISNIAYAVNFVTLMVFIIAVMMIIFMLTGMMNIFDTNTPSKSPFNSTKSDYFDGNKKMSFNDGNKKMSFNDGNKKTNSQFNDK